MATCAIVADIFRCAFSYVDVVNITEQKQLSRPTADPAERVLFRVRFFCVLIEIDKHGCAYHSDDILRFDQVTKSSFLQVVIEQFNTFF